MQVEGGSCAVDRQLRKPVPIPGKYNPPKRCPQAPADLELYVRPRLLVSMCVCPFAYVCMSVSVSLSMSVSVSVSVCVYVCVCACVGACACDGRKQRQAVRHGADSGTLAPIRNLHVSKPTMSKPNMSYSLSSPDFSDLPVLSAYFPPLFFSPMPRCRPIYLEVGRVSALGG